MGLGAERAIDIAARFDPGTGNGSDALHLAAANADDVPARMTRLTLC